MHGLSLAFPSVCVLLPHLPVMHRQVCVLLLKQMSLGPGAQHPRSMLQGQGPTVTPLRVLGPGPMARRDPSQSPGMSLCRMVPTGTSACTVPEDLFLEFFLSLSAFLPALRAFGGAQQRAG